MLLHPLQGKNNNKYFSIEFTNYLSHSVSELEIPTLQFAQPYVKIHLVQVL